MNFNRFFFPGYMGIRNVPMIAPSMHMASAIPRNTGFFSKITNGIRSFNWSGLLTNANKTLDVVNQAIPLVRQTGPMINNMRSMLRVAKAFGSETIVNKKNNLNTVINTRLNNNTISHVDNSIGQKKETQYDSVPNFFI